MKRYPDIERQLAVRRRKVVCAPRGVPDQERGVLVCNEVRSPAPWRAGERTNVDALLCKDALQGVPHARHRLAMPVLGARHQQAERHVWELHLDQRLGPAEISEHTHRGGNERYLALPGVELARAEGLVGDEDDGVPGFMRDFELGGDGGAPPRPLEGVALGALEAAPLDDGPVEVEECDLGAGGGVEVDAVQTGALRPERRFEPLEGRRGRFGEEGMYWVGVSERGRRRVAYSLLL